jgi:hypothetical protein
MRNFVVSKKYCSFATENKQGYTHPKHQLSTNKLISCKKTIFNNNNAGPQ